VRFVSRDAALLELNRAAGMEEVIASLPQNPLPDASCVKLSTAIRARERLDLEFQSLPKVAYVQADSLGKRLDAPLRLGGPRCSCSRMLGSLSWRCFNTSACRSSPSETRIELCR